MAKKEQTLHEYLIGKLRSASQKWPGTYNIKKRVRVNVTVQYNPGNNFVTVVAPKTEYTLANGEKRISPAQTFSVPIIKKAQNRDRVMYVCEKCGRLFFDYEYLMTKKGNVKKTTIIAIDHIFPIVSPDCGFIDWAVYINRLFPGSSGLQLLCNYPDERDGTLSCHRIKTTEEKGVAAARVRAEKGITNEPKKSRQKKTIEV